MNAEQTQADPHRSPIDPTAAHANGSPHIKSREFARRAKAMFSNLPSSLDEQMKHHPYTTFGIALAIGMGAGILLGSRILRSVLAGAASYAVIEFGRAYLRQPVAGAQQADN
jgi:ElaB/YqjD/DUF883 family membrane-anchored ribosome-binding protein